MLEIRELSTALTIEAWSRQSKPGRRIPPFRKAEAVNHELYDVYFRDSKSYRVHKTVK